MSKEEMLAIDDEVVKIYFDENLSVKENINKMTYIELARKLKKEHLILSWERLIGVE